MTKRQQDIKELMERHIECLRNELDTAETELSDFMLDCAKFERYRPETQVGISEDAAFRLKYGCRELTKHLKFTMDKLKAMGFGEQPTKL
jgi:hypothetical protein